MDLEQAIKYTIQKEGIGIVNEKRFVNYLHDLGAFTQPAMKRIISVMSEGGYCTKLIASIQSNTLPLVAKDIKMRLVQIEGLHEDIVSDAIKAICKAMGYILPSDKISEPTKSVSAPNATTKDNTLKIISVGANYEVELNGNTYTLNKQQYKSIIRKKNCPEQILESWLKSYTSKI